MRFEEASLFVYNKKITEAVAVESHKEMSINDSVRVAGSVTERFGRGLVEMAAPVDVKIAQLADRVAHLESENAQLRAKVARLTELVENLNAEMKTRNRALSHPCACNRETAE